MDDQAVLNAMYEKNAAYSPKIRAAILKAATSDEKSVTLAFRSVKQDPILLFALWGFARMHGVTLILPAAD